MSSRLKSKINKIKSGDGNLEGRYLNKFLYFWEPLTKLTATEFKIYLFLLSLAHDGNDKKDKFGNLKKGWIFEDIEDLAKNMKIDFKNFRYRSLKELVNNNLIAIVKTKFGEKIFVKNTDTLHTGYLPSNLELEANKKIDDARIKKGFIFYEEDNEDKSEVKPINNIDKLNEDDIKAILKDNDVQNNFFTSKSWLNASLESKRTWIIKLNELLKQKDVSNPVGILISLIKKNDDCFEKFLVEEDDFEDTDVNDLSDDGPLW